MSPAEANGPPPEDDLLMEQVTTGSADAFEELYDRYCDHAYRLAWSVCHDQGRAEDAVQEAFSSIWVARAKYVPERGTFAAWLLTSVHHRAIDVSRRNRRHADRRVPVETLDHRPGSEDIADQALEREKAQQLGVLLAELPGKQREVISLAFFGGLSHTEIAASLQLPTGTVKGRSRLGMENLGSAMKRDAA